MKMPSSLMVTVTSAVQRRGGRHRRPRLQHLRAHHVVEQDVGEAVEGQEVFCGGVEGGGQCDERVIGRGKDGERSLTGEGVDQPGSADQLRGGCGRRC